MVASRCTISLNLRASIGHVIRKEPHFASKQTFQAKYAYTKKSKHSSSASKQPIFCQSRNKIYRHSHEQDVPAISVRESSTFCLKAIITVVSHEYRHELGATCVSPPTSRPSSSPRRGRSTSASSPATDSFNPNPDQWEGKVSALLQSLRCALTNSAKSRI